MPLPNRPTAYHVLSEGLAGTRGTVDRLTGEVGMAEDGGAAAGMFDVAFEIQVLEDD